MSHKSLGVVTALTIGMLVALGVFSRDDEPASEPQSELGDYGDRGALLAGTLVVDFEDGTTKEEYDAWEQAWGIDLEFNSAEGERTGITVARDVTDVEGTLAKIRRHDEVEAAEPLMIYERFGFVPNDPDYARQWNLKLIGMEGAWEKTRGKGVTVAVLDTGIAWEDRGPFKRVPDLAGTKFVEGYDFVNDDTHANDDHGHGTHVAGTIAQSTNNREGVAGVAFEATLMPVKVLDHFGYGNSADISDAIRWAADHGAKVINLSLGGGGRSAVMEKAVGYARKKGVTVVAAAGNTGLGRVSYPAAYEGAVAVAAIGPDGRRAPYSSFGRELDIAAPGGDKRQGDSGGILQNTIDPRNPARSVYAAYQGTSMATPHVAGVAALLYSAGARNPEEVEKALYAGATPIEGKAWSDQYGHGVLNAEKSLASIRGGSNFSPLAWAAGLLAVVLLTLGRKARPGYLNILFHPGFAIPLVLSTVGVFFLHRWVGQLSGPAGDAVQVFAWPIPDWERIIFGRGKLANPIFYSALIPLVASFLTLKWKAARPVLAGLAIGFAGFLGYAAWANAPGIAYLPFTFLAIPWLVVNAAVCLFIARAMLKKEATR